MEDLRRSSRSLILGAAFLVVVFGVSGLPYLMTEEAQAIPAWSRKYDVSCQMCHTAAFPRLNEWGERFLANGYQSPDDQPDGDDTGKSALGDRLHLDTNPGHWLTARFNVTPFAYETNAQNIEGKLDDKVTIGNANWLQLFVAGSLTKNMSVYIENEFAPSGFHQAWFYLGLQNIGNSQWANLQIGRLSSVVFAPYPDRLPQLPAISKGVMRVKASGGKGEASLDLRSPRYGLQYYGYSGPVLLYAGLTPGAANPANAANELGYWVGGRLWLPEGSSQSLAGSSIGIHYDAGTDTRYAATDSLRENPHYRIMPGLNLRYNGRLDIQAVYVIAHEDNQTLAVTDRELDYKGFRAVGTYLVNDRWSLGAHYDNYRADDDADEGLLPEYHFLFLPVVTYHWRENFRVSLYPGLDLRDVDSDLKNHTVFVNIRTAI
jgi:hypothetical protein